MHEFSETQLWSSLLYSISFCLFPDPALSTPHSSLNTFLCIMWLKLHAYKEIGTLAYMQSDSIWHCVRCHFQRTMNAFFVTMLLCKNLRRSMVCDKNKRYYAIMTKQQEEGIRIKKRNQHHNIDN